MRVCLTKKLAEMIDGIDLHAHSVGDVLDLKPREAGLLIAEEWAVPERRARSRGEIRGYVPATSLPNGSPRAVAADQPRPSKLANLRLR